MKKFVFVIVFYLLVNSVAHAYDKIQTSNKVYFPNAEYLSENTVRIPFKLVDHLIVIEAEVLKQKGNFIIDTGSESLILNSTHFKNTHSVPSHALHSGVSSTVEDVRKKWLRQFFVKNFSIDGVQSDIIDLSHIEKNKKIALHGIIGYNVLKGYEVFVDFYLKQLTLSSIDDNGNKLDKLPFLEKITDSISFQLVKHTIVIDGFVNKEKLRLGLDTGAEVNLLDRKASSKVFKKFLNPKKIKVLGAGKKKMEVLAGKLHKLKLTETIYSGPMRTIITDLKSMKSTYGITLDGVLGFEFIAMRRTIINYKKEKLYFVKLPYNN